MTAAIALVDANNFYVSCKRVFQPRLIGRPVVVLSLSVPLACKSLQTDASHFVSILTTKRFYEQCRKRISNASHCLAILSPTDTMWT